VAERIKNIHYLRDQLKFSSKIFQSYTIVVDESTDAAQAAVILGTSGTLAKEQGSPELLTDYGAQGPVKLRPTCIGTIGA